MFIRFEINKDKNISINDYINKPIINNDKAIGIIINATEKENKIIIESEVWDKFIDINIRKNDINNKVDCAGVNIDLREKPYHLEYDYSFMSDEDYEREKTKRMWRELTYSMKFSPTINIK